MMRTCRKSSSMIWGCHSLTSISELEVVLMRHRLSEVMVEFEKVCHEHKPSMVVVVGDVNSTVACTMVCARNGFPVHM